MAVAELEAETLLTAEQESQIKIVWQRFRRHRLAVSGMIVILFFVLVAVFVPMFATCHGDECTGPLYDPIKHQELKNTNAGPSDQHIMGTDKIGRDVFSRLVYAARISLMVAFVVVFFQETIGSVIGAISGFYGGAVDAIIQRITEFLITIPLLPLLLAFSAMLRQVRISWLPEEWSSAVIISIILIAFGWTGSCRLVRAEVLRLRSLDFIEACRAMGLSDIRIILRHMIPNAMAPIIVNATLGLGGVIILESALSFLGFGILPPIPTWGNMLNEYQAEMWTYPMKVFWPGLVIFFASLGFNYVGDGLRDALDPRLKR